jgi:hypothetical protein
LILRTLEPSAQDQEIARLRALLDEAKTLLKEMSDGS